MKKLTGPEKFLQMIEREQAKGERLKRRVKTPSSPAKSAPQVKPGAAPASVEKS